jgi:hypothetical protein
MTPHRNREDLFRLFQATTGKTTHIPKPEADLRNLMQYQQSRVKQYYAQSNQFQRWK